MFNSILTDLPFRQMGGYQVAVQSAQNYRTLRKEGVTVRKTIDVIIGTYCIVEDLSLLHDDRDFEPMASHLSLKVLSTKPLNREPCLWGRSPKGVVLNLEPISLDMRKIDILQKYPPLMENLLQILHDFQNSNPRNYLPQKDLAMIAKYLNVTHSSIYGVVSYYTMFSLTPRGKHIIRICNSPVCHMTGAKDIFTALRENLKIGFGETTAEGLFTLESTECLGQCDQAPGMSIDGAFYGNLTTKKILLILKSYQE